MSTDIKRTESTPNGIVALSACDFVATAKANVAYIEKLRKRNAERGNIPSVVIRIFESKD